ncbi:MAG: glycosyltransferase family 2 protein [Betaproteobacteria bacterium]|nr:glycosyltransferase family 2 protein [Betaproteobacteria bacterium]
MSAEREKVCAVVATHFPDAGLGQRLERVLAQLPRAILVDNGSSGEPALLLETLARDPRVELVRNGRNLGIAGALNRGIARASELGFGGVLLVDQDTEVYPEMVMTLLRIQDRCGESAAVIGSNYFSVRRDRDLVTCRGRPAPEWIERRTVITSGSLVAMKVFERIGPFREDYFIDSVDHEFCLRARARGYRVVMSCAPLMRHAIGGPTRYPAWLSPMAVFDHSPRRKYYIARNCVATMRRFARREPAWCLRQVLRLGVELVSILAVEGRKGAKAQAFFTGIGHGFAGRMGPIESSWPDGYAGCAD